MTSWQQDWAENKYWVMAHSQQHYNQIRQLAKNNDWTVDKATEFNRLLAEAEQQVPTVKTLTTAYQHIWGYFKKIATLEEKETYLTTLAQLASGHDQLGPFLKGLTVKYQVAYLLQSGLIRELDDSTGFSNLTPRQS